ncbi:pilus assembly protein [Aquibium sp. LZ166]|uniref:Pilus assembly protein n=1 Tax=Aquibium pacificus TaxID=3153579 RepID=A0ABV3SCY3_9HYPH
MSRRFSGAAGSAGRLVADRKGNYSIGFALAMLPILGGVSLAVDYSDMIRQKQAMLNALDAAGIATARRIVEGATESEIRAYAKDFFEANLGPVNAADTVLSVQLPTNTSGGGTLKLSATLDYRPYFLPSFRYLLTGTPDNEPVAFSAGNELRLKNTLEVALALDNSGSMSNLGSGSGQKRIDLLKAAAKQLVDTLVQQAALIKQVDRPVQFSLVPFAASVNVGPGNAGAAWMDGEGVSPVHHENFDWSTMSSGNRRAEKVAGVWFKKGSDWGVEENEILSRFSLYKDMKKVDTREWVVTGSEYVCTRYRSNGTCREGYWRETGYYEETLGPYASWQGCVEARPYPYNIDDTPPAVSAGATGVWTGDTATLFVPMFAPDEAGDRWATDADSSPDNYSAPNNWWNDGTEASSASIRQRNMPKFFEVRPYGTTSPQGTGPNYSCTTNPITPLTDVSTADGLTAIKTAIDAMAPSGGTNVPEGLAWGWRTVSGGEPFTQGRPEIEKGNDKIVILLTDGANTYYTPGSLGYSDHADNKSIYSSYGYTGQAYDGGSETRLFMGTSSAVGDFDYSNSNYTKALNEQLQTLCGNAKAAGILVLTVALDLSETDATENAQIDGLRACSSDSRFRKNSADPTKPAKLFWNATGANLAEKFKEIADELSNLRIVG